MEESNGQQLDGIHAVLYLLSNIVVTCLCLVIALYYILVAIPGSWFHEMLTPVLIFLTICVAIPTVAAAYLNNAERNLTGGSGPLIMLKMIFWFTPIPMLVILCLMSSSTTDYFDDSYNESQPSKSSLFFTHYPLLAIGVMCALISATVYLAWRSPTIEFQDALDSDKSYNRATIQESMQGANVWTAIAFIVYVFMRPPPWLEQVFADDEPLLNATDVDHATETLQHNVMLA